MITPIRYELVTTKTRIEIRLFATGLENIPYTIVESTKIGNKYCTLVDMRNWAKKLSKRNNVPFVDKTL